MKVPSVPSDEPARLAALISYEVLDTESEPAFDALAELAATILDVPIALVSLIDDKRQWFKASVGLKAKETSRDISFCGHVVAESAPLIVRDAFLDTRFADNPLVVGEPHIRFYAGMPLRTSDGYVLGTLCALDHHPRKPTLHQLRMLALLAGQVIDQVEARRKLRQVEAENARALTRIGRLEALFTTLIAGFKVLKT